MGSIFSKKKVTRVTEQDKAILQLKTTRDKIKQYQKRSEVTIIKDKLLAKQLIHNNRKERALLLLKKKRFIEEKLKQTDGQLNNIEQIIQDLEFAQIEMNVVDSLRVGNIALEQINQLMNIEDVEKILDETQEAVEKQKEIDALLSGAGFTKEDEEAVEEELESLLKDALETRLPDVPAANEDLILPDVPEAELDVVEKTKKKIAVAAEAS